jgi:substrate import-associated zinc metallohydrolase lipoprotein
MKNRIFILIAAALSLTAVSCDYDNPDQNVSIIEERTHQNNQFDDWLDANFVYPYNIDFKYRMEDIESDMNYTLVPARYNYSVIMAHLVKYLCLETYDEVAGEIFTRQNFPKQVHLIGSPAYNNNGTMILGVAEGGKKITLYNVNSLGTALSSAETLNSLYFKTIHHEFTHILHQTKPYESAFEAISGSDYVADYCWEEPYYSTYLSRGFITNYAQKNADEDMAEMVSVYVTNSAETWNATVSKAGSGATAINSKLEYIKKYFSTEWNIDLDELRNTVLRRESEVTGGKVDLTDITVDKSSNQD